MAGRRSPGDEAELAARLKRLGEKLDKVAQRPPRDEPKGAAPRADPAGFARAMRLSGEFIGGIVVGAFIGWLIDRLTGVPPWGMIVFLLLGFVAGIFNVLRSVGQMNQPGAGDEK